MKYKSICKGLGYVLLSLSLLQLCGCCKKKEILLPQSVCSPEEVALQKQSNETTDQASNLINNTGLSYDVNKKANVTKAAFAPTPSSLFEREYLKGVEMLEKNDLDGAINHFKLIARDFPNSEEASIAELCIAEIYFRFKNNKAALDLYKEIVRKYPGTQAAQNAEEGIKYLETFALYERSFVSPDDENHRRRRR